MSKGIIAVFHSNATQSFFHHKTQSLLKFIIRFFSSYFLHCVTPVKTNITVYANNIQFY
jgi:hypothetical protein